MSIYEKYHATLLTTLLCCCREGSEVHLSCIVVGGKPPPRVVWYKNSQLFSEQAVRREDTSTGQLVTYNNLTIIAIPRSALGLATNLRKVWDWGRGLLLVKCSYYRFHI